MAGHRAAGRIEEAMASLRADSTGRAARAAAAAQRSAEAASAARAALAAADAERDELRAWLGDAACGTLGEVRAACARQRLAR